MPKDSVQPSSPATVPLLQKKGRKQSATTAAEVGSRSGGTDSDRLSRERGHIARFFAHRERVEDTEPDTQPRNQAPQTHYVRLEDTEVEMFPSAALDADIDAAAAAPPWRQALASGDRLTLIEHYPLFSLVLSDREHLASIKDQVLSDCDDDRPIHFQQLMTDFLEQNLRWPKIPYRLPQVISEFPAESRAINQAIDAFNRHIETYYQDAELHIEPSLDVIQREMHAIIQVLKVHAMAMEPLSLLQLLRSMAGYAQSVEDIFHTYPGLLNTHTLKLTAEEQSQEASLSIGLQDGLEDLHGFQLDASQAEVTETPSRRVIKLSMESLPFHAPENVPNLKRSWIDDFSYDFNQAGILCAETNAPILNAFGMKVGGHFDGLMKTPPRLIPEKEIHLAILRQLSHRLEQDLKRRTSSKISMILNYVFNELEIQTTHGYLKPFSPTLAANLNVEKIEGLIRQGLEGPLGFSLRAKDFKGVDRELVITVLADYIYEFAHGFHANPGFALGIGANWDGTVSLSNEGGAYAYKFAREARAWSRRYRQLSLHRQGSSEVYMNAAIGAKFELQAMLIGYEHMTRIQQSEFETFLFNALIDNLVTDLYPESPYFENPGYQKYRQVHCLVENEQGQAVLESYYLPCEQGTFMQDKKTGKFKQVPMFRRAGTLTVEPFIRDSACSEDCRDSYRGNPLGALQAQHAMSKQAATRGHIVYHPFKKDEFIPDMFNGQVMRYRDGSIVPYIGVIPKNFDKHFKQDKELCASFVIRMMQSANIEHYCPKFKALLKLLKGHCLPDSSEIPSLIDELKGFEVIDVRRRGLISELHQYHHNDILEDELLARIDNIHHYFISLFKNVVHSLYPYITQGLNHFAFEAILKHLKGEETISRAHCDAIIRELKTIAPLDIKKNIKYKRIIEYLEKLTQSFFPLPTDELAMQLAQTCREQAKYLLKKKDIKAYFSDLRAKQAGMSRKQSPGMAFSLFKHGGPSKTLAKDYYRMHTLNFDSGYRDPQGYAIALPETHERAMDVGVKSAGVITQLSHKYGLLSVATRTLTRPVLRAKQYSQNTRSKGLKPFALAAGFVKGLVWDGLVVGSYKSIKGALYMVYDIATVGFNWAQIDSAHDKNPLHITSHPSNEPSVATLMKIEARNFILKVFEYGQEDSLQCETEEDTLHHSTQFWQYFILPRLPKCIDLATRQALQAAFVESRPPIEVWQASRHILKTALAQINHQAIQKLLLVYESQLSEAMVNALHQLLLLDKAKASHAFKALKSQWKLNKDDMRVIQAVYQQALTLEPAERAQLIAFTEHRGPFIHALKQRHLKLLPLENWLSGSLIKIYQDYQPDTLLSRRLIEQEKWHQLALRELEARLLSSDEASLVKAAIIEGLPKGHKQINASLNHIFNLYNEFLQQPAQWAHRFSEAVLKLNEYLKTFERPIKSTFKRKLLRELPGLRKKDTHLARSELLDFHNVTMNTWLNQLLGQVDIFSAEINNPLMDKKALSDWLVTVSQDEKSLRSLVEQQYRLAGSLDAALYRMKCLFAVIEKAQRQDQDQEVPLDFDQRVRKTGIQSYVRLWYQNAYNIQSGGETHVDEETLGLKSLDNEKARALLFTGSITMRYAIKRVSEKIPVLNPNPEAEVRQVRAVGILP